MQVSYGRHVLPARESSGAHGWGPSCAKPMSLSDRVLSLLAVDCLTRPDDYASEIVAFAESIFDDPPVSRTMPKVY